MIYGEIKKILIQKENDWGKYELAGKDGKIIVVGIIPEASVGMQVTLEGHDETNEYGDHFKITSVVSSTPNECAGALRFLSDGYIKGIGTVKAKAIVNALGKDCLDLFETPEGRAVLSTVKGITEKTVEKMLPSYEENKIYKPIVLFLNGTGTKHQVEQIYQKYGDETVSVLKKNPYRLQMDVDGFGFLKADRLAMASGIRQDSIYRLMAAIRYIIEDATMTGGHCFLTAEEIEGRIYKLLSPYPKIDGAKEYTVEKACENWEEKKDSFIIKYRLTEETVSAIEETKLRRKAIAETFLDALKNAIASGDLVEESGRIYAPKMYQTEKETAELIQKMAKNAPVRFLSDEAIIAAIKTVEERKNEGNEGIPFAATNEQIRAVHLALKSRISVISGGPGRGKTAISEIVAEAFLSAGTHYNKEEILMLAPTGRAAQRITESTGFAAMTAHRAILSMKSDGAPKGKLILCDEASMVDIYLARQILLFAQDCNLILVGDVNQIASVGPGKVLKDVIESGVVPCAMLIEGHRNAGAIAKNAERILKGRPIREYEYNEHFIYIPTNYGNILNVMVRDYLEKIREYGIKNVMLCAAMKERGAVAVNKLNAELQRIITKGQSAATFKGGRMFRVGDRVMQTKNDYQFLLKKDGDIRKGVFNGERGSVAKILPDIENDSYKVVVLFDDGSIGGYTKDTIDSLTLAYATTLHKCQGSEAPCMMMSYTFGDYMLLNRSLFYTGETRAKKEFRFYGEEKIQANGQLLSAFDLAVKRTDDAKRNTCLAARIRGEVFSLIPTGKPVGLQSNPE